MCKCIEEVKPENTKFNNFTASSKRRYLRAKRQHDATECGAGRKQATATAKQHASPFEEQHVKVRTDEEALKELANVLYGDVDELLAKGALTGDQAKLRALQAKLDQRHDGTTAATTSDESSGVEDENGSGDSEMGSGAAEDGAAEDLEL